VHVGKVPPIATDDNRGRYSGAHRRCEPGIHSTQMFKRLDAFQAWSRACHRARIRATRWDHPGMTARKQA
jgi:hypothetical protein